jgi:hypothetical protein
VQLVPLLTGAGAPHWPSPVSHGYGFAVADVAIVPCADAGVIAALHRATVAVAYRDYFPGSPPPAVAELEVIWAERLADPTAMALVACRGGRPVGSVMARADPDFPGGQLTGLQCSRRSGERASAAVCTMPRWPCCQGRGFLIAGEVPGVLPPGLQVAPQDALVGGPFVDQDLVGVREDLDVVVDGVGDPDVRPGRRGEDEVLRPAAGRAGRPARCTMAGESQRGARMAVRQGLAGSRCGRR